ncbi:uncharacterized protein LOC143531176 [Bidens hawaiensis]|uniref:uncharacterized protein LOC143531176 n=1 Tax=Bidens hawaiensis TaxID=980011 RepID=UPI00404AC8D7
MQPPKPNLRVNLVEVKIQLIKKVGVERLNQYLGYLNRFLSLKLSKSEFDKLCLGAIGKDNIRLHNQLIRAVLKNACTVTGGNKKALDGVGHHQNRSVPAVTPVTSPLTLVNGDILPPSPRKARTVARDQRVVDRKSALGSNGSINFTPFSSSTQTGDFHQQEPANQAENGALVSVNRAEGTESLAKRDGNIISGRTSLHAPLGISHFPTSIGGTNVGNNSKCVGVLHNDGLLDATTLKERMEQITIPHGLQCVSMDCANVLNNGLDVYLKSLIRSCVDLNVSRSVHKSTQSDHPNHIRSQNGQTQEQEPKPKRLINLLDFRVAMELNCKQLGDDWPILLENICCTHGFEE